MAKSLNEQKTPTLISINYNKVQKENIFWLAY